MTKWMRRGAWLVGLATLVSAACATEAPPRSYVQPNAIKKADLAGDFYYEQTVIDAPPTNGTSFIGEDSNLMRIRFDIEENYLYARRAYPQVANSEDAAKLDPTDYQGQPLAAWKIESQFDIIRDYNSSTGEQTNKIIESTERPWQDREYIRVDWSQNLVTDYEGDLGINLFFLPGYVEPVSYWQSDPSKPDALHIEHLTQDQGGLKKGDLAYLDVTDEEVVTPDLHTLYFGDQSFSFPACFEPLFGMGDYALNDCTSQVIKIRHAFAKIDPTHDVEIRDWDGQQMNQFGMFDTRYLSYNRDYGYLNSAIERTGARYNIWKQSCHVPVGASQWSTTPAELGQITSCEATHDLSGDAPDPNGKVAFLVNQQVVYTWDPTTNPNDAKCQPMMPGSCPQDPRIPWKDRQLVQIPFYAEGTMPIVYDASSQFPTGMHDETFPPSLYSTFTDIIGQWNSALKQSVADMLQKPVAQVPDIFIPCHSPVEDGDAPVCKRYLVPDIDSQGNAVMDKHGHPILHARVGDPREAAVEWINEDQAAGPLGYGPPLYDPLTGETISGKAHIYGAALDWYATYSRDLLLLENGELDTGNYINGKNVIAAIQANKAGPNPNHTLTQEQLNAEFDAMDFSWAKGFTKEAGYPDLDFSNPQKFLASFDARQKAIYKGFFTYGQPGAGDSMMNRLIDSPLEKMMMNTEMLTVDGAAPGTDFSSLPLADKARLSPLRRKAIENDLEPYRLAAETRGADYDDFSDAGFDSMLTYFKHKYCPTLAPGATCQLTPHEEDMRVYLRSLLFKSVTLHEVGHTMGMRHNFRASWDAMSYFPQYWKLRTDAVQHPDAGMAPSDGTLHPRYVNKAGGAITEFEKDPPTSESSVTLKDGSYDWPTNTLPIDTGIRNYQYTSVMDYGSEFSSDVQGLGMYDKAYMKFAYGHYVEVFTDAKTDATSKGDFGAMQTFQPELGMPSALAPGNGLASIDYQTYPTLFKNDCGSGTPDALCWNGIYERKDVPLWNIQSTSDQQGNTLLADGSGNPEVPYYFASDDFVGNLTCERFDAGADTFEQAQDIISRYNDYYILNNFKRDRATFQSSMGYLDYIYDRYFEQLRNELTWYVLLRSDFENYLATNKALGAQGITDPKTQVDNFFTDENGWGNFTAAVNLGFDELGKVLTTPSAGFYMPGTDEQGNPLWKQFNDTPVWDPAVEGGTQPSNIKVVPLIQGKYIDTQWDQNCGYYWADDCQSRIGYFVDKTVALDVLGESQAYFTGRDTSVDVRQYAIGYVLPYKRQIEEKFGAMLSDNYAGYAPYFTSNADGQQVIVNPNWALPNPPTTGELQDLLDPQTGFTLNLYAGIYALAQFPTTFDHDFIDDTKVFVVGNGEATTSDQTIQAQGTSDPRQLVSHCAVGDSSCLSSAKQWFVIQDPSGETLAAHAVAPTAEDVLTESGDTQTVSLRHDIGVQMLEPLQHMDLVLQDAETSGDATAIDQAQTAYQNYRENIQVIRSLENAFGYGPFMTDAPFYY